MFSPPTRKGVQLSTIGFGEAVAGRGYDINRAIGKFLPLVSNLLPVTTNLASPSTDLAGFLNGLERLSGAVAPVAQTQANAVRQPEHDVLSARVGRALAGRTRSRRRRRRSRQ